MLVVGSLNLDLVYRCESFPQPGETVTGSFATGPGGKGANQAVAAARAGGNVCFVAAVGKDDFARQCREFLEAEQIDLRLMEVSDAPTGNAGIIVDSKGENVIVVAVGANALLAPEHVSEDVIKDARVLVCQFESNRSTTAHALKLARKLGVLSILNPAPMHPADAASVIPLADVVIVNETEFSELVRQFHPGGYGDFTGEQIHALSDAKVHELCRNTLSQPMILTLGARGCFVSTPDGYKLISARRGLTIVDTTGAGDCFVGSLAAWLEQHPGGDLRDAAAWANCAAALACTRNGAGKAMPHKHEIDALFRGHSSS